MVQDTEWPCVQEYVLIFDKLVESIESAATGLLYGSAPACVSAQVGRLGGAASCWQAFPARLRMRRNRLHSIDGLSSGECCVATTKHTNSACTDGSLIHLIVYLNRGLPYAVFLYREL